MSSSVSLVSLFVSLLFPLSYSVDCMEYKVLTVYALDPDTNHYVKPLLEAIKSFYQMLEKIFGCSNSLEDLNVFYNI